MNASQNDPYTPSSKLIGNLIGSKGCGGHRGNANEIAFFVKVDFFQTLIDDFDLMLPWGQGRKERKAGLRERNISRFPFSDTPCIGGHEHNLQNDTLLSVCLKSIIHEIPSCATMNQGREVRKFFSVAIFIVLLLRGSYDRAFSQNLDKVIVSEIKGVITPISEDFVSRTIAHGVQEKARALILLLDTPGGLEESMRNIVKAFLQSPLPVVIYVSPQGARAASAGSFLLVAAHHAFMSPNTTVGAAHPVTVEGQTVSEKIVNDAASFMRSLAETRGRNPEVAEKMVRESLSLTEKEALKQGLIEGVVENLGEIFATLRLGNPRVIRVEMNWKERTLQYILNPNLAYLLLTLGALGMIFELANPGAVVPGVFGSIAILLAFYAFSILPVNFVGILLIFLGLLFLILDILVIPGIGILSVGGILSLFLGSLALFNPERGITVSMSLVITVTVCMAVFFSIVLVGITRTMRQKARIGAETLAGKHGVARDDLLPEGFVVIEGELWWAKSEEPVRKGERVKVLRKEGQILIVKRGDKA